MTTKLNTFNNATTKPFHSGAYLLRFQNPPISGFSYFHKETSKFYSFCPTLSKLIEVINYIDKHPSELSCFSLVGQNSGEWKGLNFYALSQNDLLKYSPEQFEKLVTDSTFELVI